MYGVHPDAVGQLSMLSPSTALPRICELLKKHNGDMLAAADQLLADDVSPAAAAASSAAAPAPATSLQAPASGSKWPSPPRSPAPEAAPAYLADYPPEVQQLCSAMGPSLNPAVALMILREVGNDVQKAFDLVESMTAAEPQHSSPPKQQQQQAAAPQQPSPRRQQARSPSPVPPPTQQLPAAALARLPRELVESGQLPAEQLAFLAEMSHADMHTALAAMGISSAPTSARSPSPLCAPAAQRSLFPTQPPPPPPPPPQPATQPPPPPPRPTASAPKPSTSSAAELENVRRTLRDMSPTEAKAFIDEQHKMHQRMVKMSRVCFDQASQAMRSGSYSTAARAMQQKGEDYKALAVDFKAKANAAAFKAHNRASDTHLKLDLHGLHVEDALKKLEDYIRAVTLMGSGGLLHVITGKGLNSKGGQPQVKVAVERWLHEGGYRFQEVRGNSGAIDVTLD
jgi:DNA-nicking Smr family endonuclease